MSRDQETEEWRPVLDFEGLYEISDQGRVRSLPNCAHRDTRVLTLRLSDAGHHYILFYHPDFPKRRIKRYVHRLVLEAFVGRCPPGLEACHNDGKHLNNVPTNLRWDTRLSNTQDQKRHGVAKPPVVLSGEKHQSAKLLDEDVRCILAEPPFAGVNKMLARAFCVSRSHIRNLRARDPRIRDLSAVECRI